MILTFVAKANYDGALIDDVITGAVWGGKSVNSGDPIGAAVAALIGEILAMVGFICACALVFVPLKDEKIKKILFIVAGALLVAGGVMLFFTKAGVADNYAKYLGAGTKASDVEPRLSGLGAAVVAGILNLVAGGAVVASQFVPDNKLGK